MLGSIEKDRGVLGIFGVEGDGVVVCVEVGAEFAEEDVSDDHIMLSTGKDC